MAAEVTTTTTGTMIKNNFKIPDEIKLVATTAAKCKNLILTKELRKKHEKLEGNSMPKWELYLEEKDCAETGCEETLVCRTCQ